MGTGLSILVGWERASIFFLVAAPTLAMGILLNKKIRPEWAVLAATFSSLIIVLIAVWIFHYQGGEIASLKDQTGIWLSEIANTVLETQDTSLEEAKRKSLEEIIQEPEKILPLLPGSVFSILLLFYTLPFTLLLSWNPQEIHKQMGVQSQFLRKWSAPDFLVWPTIFCAAFLVFKIEPLEIFMNNIFKVFMAIYFLQGLSILAFFLNKSRLRSPLHIPIYVLAMLFLWPLLTGFGFFDLWCNFRKRWTPKKIKASNK